MNTSFGDKLTDSIRKYGPLCVGFDPHPARIPTLFGDGLPAIRAFFLEVLERIKGKTGIIKPQIALFERFGPAGLELLAELTFAAKEAGLLVLLDAKRGDIGSTAQGYAESYLGTGAWLHADAITINPYMGTETLEPFFDLAKDNDKGAIVLVRTSNPGAADFQELQINGQTVFEAVAQKLAPYARDLTTGTGSWSSLMVVVGATAPNEAKRLRVILPNCPFLVPGYGAQGASASEALAANINGEGVVVNSSRGILYPQGARRAKGFEAWAELFDTNLTQTKRELAAAL